MFELFRKKAIIVFVGIILLVLVSMLIFGLIRNIDKLHLEKIPFIRPFILQMQKPFFPEASKYPYPITWDKLDERPKEYDSTNSWFDFLNSYTRLQLKRYMKENDLYIVPKDYNMDTAYDFEDCLNELEFRKIGE